MYFEVVTTLPYSSGLPLSTSSGPVMACDSSDRPLKLRRQKHSRALGAILEHTFPTSIIDAMARGEVLQIVVFSFLFGAACASIGAAAKPVVAVRRVAGRGDVPLYRSTSCTSRRLGSRQRWL